MRARMTLKQKRFCEEYARCGNATQAAQKAGYSKRTAKEIGRENLTKPHLQAYLKTLTSKSEETRIASALERQALLSEMVLGRLSDTHVPGRRHGDRTADEAG